LSRFYVFILTSTNVFASIYFEPELKVTDDRSGEDVNDNLAHHAEMNQKISGWDKAVEMNHE